MSGQICLVLDSPFGLDLRVRDISQAVIILGIAMVLLLPRIVGLALPWIARFPIPGKILPQDIADYSPILPGLLAAILMLWVVLRRIGPNLLWFQQHDDPARAQGWTRRRQLLSEESGTSRFRR